MGSVSDNEHDEGITIDGENKTIDSPDSLEHLFSGTEAILVMSSVALVVVHVHQQPRAVCGVCELRFNPIPPLTPHNHLTSSL